MGRSCLRARACRPAGGPKPHPPRPYRSQPHLPMAAPAPRPRASVQCLHVMGRGGARARSRAMARLRARTGTATERRRCAVQRTHRQQHHVSEGIYGALDCIDLATRSSMCPKGLHERCPGTRMHITSACENDSTAATERRQRAIQRTHRLQHRVTRRDRGHCTDPATRSSMCPKGST
jgi:hypothetical protein